MNYYLSSSDHVTGPYEKEELIDSVKYGMVSPDSTICREGSDEWLPITVLTEKKAEIVAGPQTPFTQLQQTRNQPVSVQQQPYRLKSTRTAVLLEIIPGLFMQTFGIGNIYAGNVVTGLILMLTYWALFLLNLFLVLFIVGLITLPLTFVAYLVISIISAQKAVDRNAWQTIMSGKIKA